MHVTGKGHNPQGFFCLFVCLFVTVLGLELRAYTLSHSTSPFLVKGFFKLGSPEVFAQGKYFLISAS
jgi:hypothetical protein